jgi:WD repeat-containing protein 48
MSQFRAQVQAHTHWVNDIVLAHASTSGKHTCYALLTEVISCSSDMTVKLWRPHSVEESIPSTLGSHADYVKCLALPSDTSTWVASGGLDRSIVLWDVSGQGSIHRFDVGEGTDGQKSSVYTLGVGGGILASGGPEKVVRIWDPKSGKRVTKFVGHTDNVRSIILSDDGQTMLTASSDTTIKLWSVAMRRCFHTFTMHSDSVWTLHSLHPRLEVFHAGDRSGLVTKTDLRGVTDIDDADCVAVYKEHYGVTKLVGVGNRLWSATRSSSINRWEDTPEWDPSPALPVPMTRFRASSVAAKDPPGVVPSQALLRLTSVHDTLLSVRPISSKEQDSVSVFSTHVAAQGDEPYQIIPVREDPEFTIPGQHGLIKHVVLNDRRRVLTLDTSHAIALWDIVECKQLKSFGAMDIHEVEKTVNSNENVSNWCTVDTRIGSITVMLDERNCFDAEVYRDEIGFEDDSDERINIGKWVLRYLFTNLIEAEQQRDEAVRKVIERNLKGPLKIHVPPPGTPAEFGFRGRHVDTTPSIGVATPCPPTPFLGPLFPDPSARREPGLLTDNELAGVPAKESLSAGVNGEESTVSVTPSVPPETHGTIPEPAKESSFMGRLKSFGVKKLQKSEKDDVAVPIGTNGTEKEDEKLVEDEASRAKETPYMFSDVLSTIKKTYERAGVSDPPPEKSDSSLMEALSKFPVIGEDGKVKSIITLSSATDTPVIHPSQDTIIIIAEQNVSVDGGKDLYRGTVSSVGHDIDLLESIAPGWLAELLLLVIPPCTPSDAG